MMVDRLKFLISSELHGDMYLERLCTEDCKGFRRYGVFVNFWDPLRGCQASTPAERHHVLEDKIKGQIDALTPAEQALAYQYLYALGYRISGIGDQINREIKKELGSS